MPTAHRRLTGHRGWRVLTSRRYGICLQANPEGTMTKRTVTAVLLTAAIALLVGIRLGGQTGSRGATAGALPPASIPTFSTENLGRMAHFYVGGHYVGGAGKEQMDGAMYVEV